MTRMIFEWKQGSRYSVGAQIAAERLNKIKAENGALTPEGVVTDASSEASPLHKEFEWDDAKAAHAHRLDEARKLIGSIVVAQVDNSQVRKETRGFLHVTTGGNRYESIDVVMSRPDLHAEAVARAKSEIGLWRARHAALVEFASIHSAIDQVLAA